MTSSMLGPRKQPRTSSKNWHLACAGLWLAVALPLSG